MNMTADNYNSIANHNLSSVLSQIQDNGPAYPESAKPGNTQNAPPQGRANYNAASSNQPNDTLYGDDTVSISSNRTQEKPQNRSSNPAQTKKEITPGVWLQLLLLLISAALLASTLFKLDAQSNDIESSLSVYDETIDEKIQESVDLQKSRSSDGTTKIKATLLSLQNELQAIKKDYSTLDKKYVALAQSKASAETKNNSALQGDVNVFKDEILSLKSELQAVKSKLKTIKPENNSAAKTTASNGLTVMLASLTNKSKAEKIIEQLYAEGLVPNMQQAVVRGERVYRLSVSGFFNRDEAESFIRKADEKYGMKDSRIRKS